MDYKETDKRAVDTAMRKAFKPDKNIPEQLRDLLRRLTESEARHNPEH